MRILVTGSEGFIGGHVMRSLTDDGHDVRGLDLKNANGDVRSLGDVTHAAQDCDAIIHLAAVASVQETIKDSLGTAEHNVTGTRNVFQAAIDNENIPVVYASSAAVYGDNQILPLSENEIPNPLSPYADHKWQNEKDAAEFARAHGLKTFGVRFFNIYGAGQDPSSPYSGVISVFHDRLARNEPITIFGDGQQSRDFVCVDDAVTALKLGLKHASTDALILNVCTGQQTSLLDLIHEMGIALNQTPIIRHEPARDGDIRHSCGNPSRLNGLCGFKPSIPLSHGLKFMVEGSES
jgi:UDP-glucose 4-epimerase